MKNYQLFLLFFGLPIILKSQTPATPDLSFAKNGFFFMDRGTSGGLGRDAIFQPDGKILVAGSTAEANPRLAVIRLNPDGSPDGSFGFNGQIVVPALAVAIGIALQADGKIVVSGSTKTVSDSKMAVVRLLADGKKDQNFGSNGVAEIDFGTGLDFGNSVKILPDGKIVVAGTAALNSSVAVAKLLSNGILDVGFGNAGKILWSKLQSTTSSDDMAIQPDGKIIIAGQIKNTSTAKTEGLLLRFLPSGVLDASFGTGGAKIYGEHFADFFRGASLSADGKILAGGQFFTSPPVVQKGMVVRFLPSGAVDASFGTSGVAASQSKTKFHQLHELPDGKILAAGTVADSQFTLDIFLTRFLPDGKLDPSFGAGGATIFGQADENENVFGMDVWADGNFVLAGDYSNKMQTLRFQPDGQFQSTFGNNGHVLSEIYLADNEGVALGLQKNGKIISTDRPHLVGSNGDGVLRHSPDGILDNSFGKNGIAEVPFTQNGWWLSQTFVLPDDKILRLAIGNSDRVAMAKMNPDGSPDPSFGIGGSMIDSSFGNWLSPQFPISPSKWAIQPDGKILLLGQGWYTFLARYLPNGAPDLLFGDKGKKLLQIAINDWDEFVVQNDGKILVESTIFLQTRVNRFLENGAPDLAFGNNGHYDGYFFDQGSVSIGGIMKLQPDGKLLLCATENQAFVGKSLLLLTRITAEGKADSTFGKNGLSKIEFDLPNLAIAEAVFQPDGKILAVGNQVELGTPIHFFRVLADGRPDSTFGQAGHLQYVHPDGATLFPTKMFLDKSNKAVVLGTKEDEFGRDYFLARFHTGISVDVSDINLSEKIAISLSPNPTDGRGVFVDFEISKSGQVEIGLLDLNGKKAVLLSKLAQQPGKHREFCQIPASCLNGLYFLTAQMESGFGGSKLVLQR